MRKFILALLLLPSVVLGQTASTFMLKPDGTIATYVNFFDANSNALNAAVGVNIDAVTGIATNSAWDALSVFQATNVSGLQASSVTNIVTNFVTAFRGPFTGNGSGLTNIPGTSITGPLSDQQLIAYVDGESYHVLTAQRDSDEIVTNATVLWPDGTYGVFTRLSKNTSIPAINSYSVTYTNRSITITQPTLSRDSAGAATNVPALIIN